MAPKPPDPRALERATRAVLEAMAEPSLPGATAEALGRYVGSLARFGAHTDLVGAHTAEGLAEIALADALVLARQRERCRAPSWEIGAGGASLSVPLALIVPELSGRLIEPRQKRATFLRMAIGALGLAKRLVVEQSRVEPDAPPQGVASLALGRAVFAPGVWVPMARAVVAPGGAFAVLSTGELSSEERAGMEPVATERYELPFARASRVVTWFERPAEPSGRG